MASAVLGKRRRDVDSDIGAALGRTSRVKRRVQIHIASDDEGDSGYTRAQDGNCIQLDTPKRVVPNQTHIVPAKNVEHFHATVLPTISDRALEKAIIHYNDENTVPRVSTPHTPRHHDALSNKFPVTPRHRVLVGGKPFTPRTPRTPTTPSSLATSVYNDAKKVFSRSADPGELVGRTTEREELRSFIDDRNAAGQGGCLYVSGPPGTGKSALVTETCRSYQRSDSVRYAYVNCMSIRTAASVYAVTMSELGLSDDVFHAGVKENLQSACVGRDDRGILLVVLDEIDQLLCLDTDVLYNLFDWSLQRHSRLVLIGIANALDLTDRFLPRLKARNMKPTLLPFLPYTAAETASVLTARARSLFPKRASAPSDFTPFLHPAAIQLISKKVAAQTGDLRKAFDIARCAIELVETETKEKLARDATTEQQKSPPTPSRSPLGENMNVSSPSSMSTASPTKTPRPVKSASTIFSHFTAETAPRATLAHVVRVTSIAFNNGASQRLKVLTLQQKAVLCALVSLEQRRRHAAGSLPSPPTPSAEAVRKQGLLATPTNRSGRSNQNTTPAAPPTMRVLFDAYTALCKRDNVLHALSSTEFRDVIANLETLSLVGTLDGAGKGGLAFAGTTPSKRGRGGAGSGLTSAAMEQRRLKASVGIVELEAAVEGVGSGILKAILSGEGFD